MELVKVSLYGVNMYGENSHWVIDGIFLGDEEVEKVTMPDGVAELLTLDMRQSCEKTVMHVSGLIKKQNPLQFSFIFKDRTEILEVDLPEGVTDFCTLVG